MQKCGAAVAARIGFVSFVCGQMAPTCFERTSTGQLSRLNWTHTRTRRNKTFQRERAHPHPPRSIPSRRPRDLAVWCERLCLCMFCIDSDARHMRELHIKHRRRAPRFASARPGLRVLNAFGRFGGGLAAVKLRTFRTFRTF